MEFNGFGAFALHLLSLEAAQVRSLQKGLETVARRIEKTAQSEFGTYQKGIGPFPKWAPLALETQMDRSQQGYRPNEPLLRSGDLRRSISHKVEGLEAVIGSTSEIMVYQELGTETIPPRPVLGPAAIRNMKATARILGNATMSGLLPPGHVGALNGPSEPDYNNEV